MEEETPLSPSVRVPRQLALRSEGLNVLLDRASTLAVEWGIGLQSRTSELLPSLFASASENLRSSMQMLILNPIQGLTNIQGVISGTGVFGGRVTSCQ